MGRKSGEPATKKRDMLINPIDHCSICGPVYDNNHLCCYPRLLRRSRPLPIHPTVLATTQRTQPAGSISTQISAQISARPTRPPLERFETTRSNILARHFTETGSIENYETFQRTKPRLRTAEKVLATLCDVQIFTTTSVLIAAYVLGNKLTYYHGGVVTNYYWFAVQSFWASRQHKWWETPEDVLAQQNAEAPRPRKPLRHHLREFFIKDEPFRLYIRRFFIFACTTLFVVLYGISIQDQAVKWDPLTPGKCFRSGDASDGPSDWFWLAGISVYGIVLF